MKCETGGGRSGLETSARRFAKPFLSNGFANISQEAEIGGEHQVNALTNYVSLPCLTCYLTSITPDEFAGDGARCWERSRHDDGGYFFRSLIGSASFLLHYAYTFTWRLGGRRHACSGRVPRSCSGCAASQSVAPGLACLGGWVEERSRGYDPQCRGKGLLLGLGCRSGASRPAMHRAGYPLRWVPTFLLPPAKEAVGYGRAANTKDHSRLRLLICTSGVALTLQCWGCPLTDKHRQ